MLMRAVTSILIGLVLTGSAAIEAQTRSVDPVLRAATEGLAIGSRLRIVTASDGIDYGHLLGLDAAGIRWEDERRRQAQVTTQELIQLSTRRRSWRKGMFIGGAAGAVVGVFGGLLANAACESGQGCTGDDGLSYAMTGALTLGLLGGASGAAIGGVFQEWHVVHGGYQ